MGRSPVSTQVRCGRSSEGAAEALLRRGASSDGSRELGGVGEHWTTIRGEEERNHCWSLSGTRRYMAEDR